MVLNGMNQDGGEIQGKDASVKVLVNGVNGFAGEIFDPDA